MGDLGFADFLLKAQWMVKKLGRDLVKIDRWEPTTTPCHSLDALRIHALPVRESCPSKLGEMGLQLGLGQPFSVEFVVAILKRHRVIPDLGRNVQVLEPFADGSIL